MDDGNSTINTGGGATDMVVMDSLSGRFAQFEAKIPALTFTISVWPLVELLNELT